MKINVFDVSHGFCSLITSDNGARILVDCGHKEKEFYPSSYLRAIGCNQLEGLIIQNYDQDHVSDIVNVWNQAPPIVWYCNSSVSGQQLTVMKQATGIVTAAMSKVVTELTNFTPAIYFPDLGGVELYPFFHKYPTFTNENNLSVVTFVTYGQFRILFSGDLEKDGWTEMLKDQYFRQMLGGVTIFVASHHGRENGYCKEVFDHCSPDMVVISDKEIVHKTQLTNYSNVVPYGVNFGARNRKTLTTRSDGNIVFDVDFNGYYRVRLRSLT